MTRKIGKDEYYAMGLSKKHEERKAGSGKNLKWRKNKKKEENRELILKGNGEEYAQVTRMLGYGWCEARIPVVGKRVCRIPGKMQHRKVWIKPGDIILVSLCTRDNKVEVVHKYHLDEAKSLIDCCELPHYIKLFEGLNDADIALKMDLYEEDINEILKAHAHEDFEGENWGAEDTIRWFLENEDALAVYEKVFCETMLEPHANQNFQAEDWGVEDTFLLHYCFGKKVIEDPDWGLKYLLMTFVELEIEQINDLGFLILYDKVLRKHFCFSQAADF